MKPPAPVTHIRSLASGLQTTLLITRWEVVHCTVLNLPIWLITLHGMSFENPFLPFLSVFSSFLLQRYTDKLTSIMITTQMGPCLWPPPRAWGLGGEQQLLHWAAVAAVAPGRSKRHGAKARSRRGPTPGTHKRTRRCCPVELPPKHST